MSDSDKEEERSTRFGDDWMQRYVERKRLESQARVVVRRLAQDRRKRRDPVKQLIDLSMDVWDVLALQTEMPLPPSFDSESNWDVDMHGEVPAAPLSVKYWSNEAKLVISRAYAIHELQRLRDAHGTAEEVPFQDAMFLLSCFYSHSPSETAKRMDDMIMRCDEYMEENHFPIHPREEGFTHLRLCQNIATFMNSVGYGVANPEQYRRLLNSFPHYYLSDDPEARKTIPLALVHIFSCLGRHYGLDVYPVNFPRVVLARVNVAGHPPDGFFLVNLATTGSDFVIPAPTESIEVMASNALTVLTRASRNVLASMQQHRITFGLSDAHWSIFCIFTIQLLLCPEDEEPLHLVKATGNLPCMECYTFLMALVPLLDEPRREPLKEYCHRSLMQEDREAITMPPKRRTEVDVKYFVGQVMLHKELDYYGCIIGWDEGYDKSPESMRQVDRTDESSRGLIRRDQPYYRVYRLDDASIRYVPQDCIRIIPLTAELAGSFCRKGSDFNKSFGDVQLSTISNERGRFRPSAEVCGMYPEDEFYGMRWVREGREAVAEQDAKVEAFAQQFKDYL